MVGNAAWDGDVSLTGTQNKTGAGEGQILTHNSAVTFSVLTNVGTAVMEINFFFKKKLYIQFAVDIPYVLLFVFIYDYQFNINIVSKKTSL